MYAIEDFLTCGKRPKAKYTFYIISVQMRNVWNHIQKTDFTKDLFFFPLNDLWKRFEIGITVY